MAEVKRPQEVEMYNGGGIRHGVYIKSDADAYMAALERRVRIAERAVIKGFGSINGPKILAKYDAEIDSEKGEG